MHIYNHITKLCVSALLISSLGCQADLNATTTKNINSPLSNTTSEQSNIESPNKQPVVNANYQVKDWTTGRIEKNTNNFKIKSASSNLKIDNTVDVFPQPTDNKYLIDSSKLISSNNTSLSGRITTDTASKEVTGKLTYMNTDAAKTEVKAGDKVLVLATGETLNVKEVLPERYLMNLEKGFEGTVTIPKGTQFTSVGKEGTVTGTFYKDLAPSNGAPTTAELVITSDYKTIDKSITAAVGTGITIEGKDVTVAPQKFLSDTFPKFKTTESAFKIVVAGNNRAKSFGATSSSPAIELNNPTISSDNVLYYTTNNASGSNFFATDNSGTVLWENTFSGGFQGAAPTFSSPTNNVGAKTYLGKRIMYVASKSGEIFCLNTDGRIVSTIKINDSFKNSVWVNADDQDIDYIYALSTNGNLYRLKLDFSNPQAQTFTSMYSVKVADTSFYSSPIMNGSSLYVGGENGTFYEIIPNTGDVSRSWDLSKYPMNSSAKIVGMPAFSNDVIIVPAGGYLFRIVGSTVSQSPLLELNQGLASRIKPYGSVFKSNSQPTGNIISSPIIPPNSGKVYISNANTVFESDFLSVDNFKNYSTYCLSISGRLDDSDSNLKSYGNGTLDLTQVGDDTTKMRVSMVDINTVNNNSPYLNFFSVPLNSGADTLTGYMPLNEFDSKGHPISGYGSSVVADNKGSVYLTLDNGAVNIVPAR